MSTEALDFGDDFIPTDDDALATAQVLPVEGEDDDELETAEELAARLAEEAAEAEAQAAQARIRIPKSRFDEAVNKERERADAALERAAALEAQLQAAQRIQQPQPAVNNELAEVAAYLDEQQAAYEQFLIDGMTTEARAARVEVERARDYLMNARISHMAEVTRNDTLTTLKYESTLANIEQAYPVLDPDGPAYDDKVANEVADLVDAFMAQGKNNVQALRQAVKYVMGAPAAQPATPAPTPREVEARKKAAAVLAAQPPNTALTGKTAATAPLNFKGMTVEQFSKVDEETRAKARGDVL